MKLKALEEQNKNIWISTTGYRIFLELKSLLESPKTVEELIEIIKQNPYINKELSKDTVRFDIITLRNAGCVITKPVKSNGHKMQVLYHPFTLTILPEEFNLFLELRENMAQEISLNEIFTLNDLYDKIVSLTFNNEQIQKTADTKLLSDINRDILKDISNPSIIGKKVQIKYKSPKFGEEDTDIIPIKIVYENKKVYLCAYNYKYKSNSFFEVSKILKINSVSLNKAEEISPSQKVLYEVQGEALNGFELKSYEKITEKSENKIKIEADVSNEFMFIQRLFLLGRDFKIISPDDFKEKLINKIKLIQKGYKNAKL